MHITSREFQTLMKTKRIKIVCVLDIEKISTTKKWNSNLERHFHFSLVARRLSKSEISNIDERYEKKEIYFLPCHKLQINTCCH